MDTPIPAQTGEKTLMFIYAGIDEAGYGPMFGPLVIARTIFTLSNFHERAGASPPPDPPAPPDLWALLEPAVCRKTTDKQRRIAVDDSKKLYTPAAGLRHIERGVLAFAAAAGIDTGDLTRWLHAVGYDEASCRTDLPWYRTPASLPTCIDAGLLAIARAQLTRVLTDAGVQLQSLRAAILFEDRFNHMVQATRSKSRCEWTFVAGHLTDIWRQFGRHHPFVVIDRQGGRTHYQPLLALCFDGVKVQVLDETPEICRYELTRGDHAMIVSFEAGSEERHLPVALASMTAKYTRELLMARFNAFWQSYDPSLKPTAGYVTDGRRFLRDIEPLMQKLNIPHESLIRAR
ncbi:MAG: ribonuclease H family protein [Phycisphaerales bacterium]